MHISKVLNGRNVHINFYSSDIRFVTKSPAPGLPLRSLISRESAPVCREFPQIYLVSSGQCPGFVPIHVSKADLKLGDEQMRGGDAAVDTFAAPGALLVDVLRLEPAFAVNVPL